MTDELKILTTTARIEDSRGMAAFLAPIPDNAELAALLAVKEPVNTRAYDDDNLTARFVISDGVTVICFTVADITIDQAEMITVACEEADAWDDAAFRLAAHRALQYRPD